MEEKSLDDFFKKEFKDDNSSKARKRRENKNIYRERNTEESFLGSFFRNRFSFDVDVDLTNPTSVLYRRNYVIKNIIFLANLVFVIFSFIGISTSNILVTVLFWLLIFGFSQTIKQMLKTKTDDFEHQTIIMYLQSIFVFVLSIVLYIKLWFNFAWDSSNGGFSQITNDEYAVTQAAYILIYFTIVIISLYQNPKLLLRVSFWAFIGVTVINLSLLHPELFNHGSSIKDLFNYMFKENKEISIDILLRTIVFVVFFAALYSSVTISSYMNEQRKSEFTKRVGVESNFKDVVNSVFEAVKAYNTTTNDFEQKVSAQKVSKVAKELAIAMNLDSEKTQELVGFATVHTEKMHLLSIDNVDENNFDEITTRTSLATTIIKRLQIRKKAEDIVLNYFQNQITADFMYSTRESIDRFSMLILISEIYVILRGDRSYKKSMNHQRCVEVILSAELEPFFDKDIIARFTKYNHEIEIAYNKAF